MSDLALEIQRLREENARLAGEVKALRAEKDEMQTVINDLRSMMAWFRKKMFGAMSEKHLPLDPNVLEPSLFDLSLPEEEQLNKTR